MEQERKDRYTKEERNAYMRHYRKAHPRKIAIQQIQHWTRKLMDLETKDEEKNQDERD